MIPTGQVGHFKKSQKREFKRTKEKFV